MNTMVKTLMAQGWDKYYNAYTVEEACEELGLDIEETKHENELIERCNYGKVVGVLMLKEEVARQLDNVDGIDIVDVLDNGTVGVAWGFGSCNNNGCYFNSVTLEQLEQYVNGEVDCIM